MDAGQGLGMQPDSEEDARAADDDVDAFAGQLLGHASRCARTSSLSRCHARAGDIRIKMAVAEVEIGGSRIELLHDAEPPHGLRRADDAVDGYEVRDRRRAHRIGTGTAACSARPSEVAA